MYALYGASNTHILCGNYEQQTLLSMNLSR